MPNLPLNRKPTTLASCDPDIYLYAWRCASQRARLATDPREEKDLYETANALYALYEQRKVPAFLPQLPKGIIDWRGHGGEEPRFDRLQIDRSAHIDRAMNNSQPITVPDYISESICDDDRNWKDILANWLKVNDDENRDYVYGEMTIGADGDLQGEITMAYFYIDDRKDEYYTGFYAVIDGDVYDCTDTTIKECGILNDTIGWYLTDLHGEQLPEDLTYRLTVGYSNDPTNELDEIMDGRSEPIWHWGLNCFVARIRSWPHPVRMYPANA